MNGKELNRTYITFEELLPGGDYCPGYRKEDVYRWIENDLKFVSKDKSVIFFNHGIADFAQDVHGILYAIDANRGSLVC